LQGNLASLTAFLYKRSVMKKTTEDNSVAELTRAMGLLIRRVRAAAAGNGLSLSESMVLSRLDKDGPATTAELARAEGVRPQSMRTTVAALEQMELVKRSPHPTDGRQVNLAATAKGRALRQKARQAKHTWLAEAIAQLDAADRATLFAAGDIIERLVKM